MLLRNYWYAAAWSHEIGDAPLRRTVLNEPLVIFRAAGKIAAFRDRCPHRAVPLSKGRVVDGTLECAYHGLRFDPDGRCTLVPGQDHVPPGTTVKSFPCVERWRYVWVWLGDAETADPDRIPDLPWLSDPGWVAPNGSIYLRAGHELLIENLQNHTHLQLVHRSTIGTDNICTVRPKMRRVGDEVHIERWLLDRPPPALFARAGGFDGKVDRWFNSVFVPPSTTILDIGCAKAGTGAPTGDRSQGIEIRSLHVVTPENENTTHYFWAYARNFRIDDTAVTEMLRAGAAATFDEDVAILEAQQANLERFPEEPPLWLSADSGGVAVRRVRRELADRESAVTTPEASGNRTEPA